MNNRIITVLMTAAMLSATVNAQLRQPHSLYFMETVPQVTQMNPALQPRANVYVMLPGVNVDFLSDIAMKDILQRQGSKWVTPVEEQYDYGQLRRAIGRKATMFNAGADVDIIGFGFRTGEGRGYFTFNLSEHMMINTGLPSDLFKITEKGFPDGTELDFSPLRTNAMAYMQLAIGKSHRINDRLTVGANLKLLLGHAAVKTKIDRFQLNTAEKEWSVSAKGNIYASAPMEVILDQEGKIDSIAAKDFSDYDPMDWVKDYGTSFSNPGIALDLGASYQLTEKLNLSASLNNIGFISWKQDLNSASFNGQYVFNGVYYDVAQDKDFETILKDIAKELEEQVNYTATHERFKTFLPPVLHAGAEYQLTKAVSAGLLSRTVFWNRGIRQSFNGSLNWQPYSFLSVNAGATWQVKGNVYFGTGLQFFLGPLQFYCMVDGIPGRYSSIRVDGNGKTGTEINFIPEHQKSITARLGFNLVFGRNGYVNKPMLDKGRNSWN